ncbi:MAG: translation initiation factor IF-2 subunit beta [Thermoplasmata archaeon]|nr:MAG: translation initiation factor IF-2 subunit beta [Thermoplasmata archaeon]RLF73651.1 MAG: translation initiation factor IF-2 subunit beta [Thermoplasmata archaeon]HDD59893.1 translation initiation factor IF-2 subunit beta [Euryarchaeota archaeon]
MSEKGDKAAPEGGQQVEEELLYDYENLLERAWERIPQEVVASSERFEVPQVDVLYEGKSTILRNFVDIVQRINRMDHLEQIYKFLLKELGTAGVIDGRRLVMNSVIPEEKIGEKIKDYVETYVLCSECGRPDTRLEKEGRVLMLVCTACGARRPVRVKKGRTTQEEKGVIKVGDIMEVTVQSVGRQGDGMVRMGKYLMFIPGCGRGEKVKVKVESVKGNIIIARPVE